MLKNAITPIVFLVSLVACGVTVKFSPIDHLPNDKATVVFYMDNGRGAFNISIQAPIIANGIELATLNTGESVTKYLEPGSYKLHSDTSAIDRISNFTFDKGKLYFIRVWLDRGFWVASLRFTLTEKPEQFNI